MLQLLDFPPELLNHITKHIVTYDHPLISPRHLSRAVRERSRPRFLGPGILSTNHFFHDPYLSYFYSHNIFVISSLFVLFLDDQPLLKSMTRPLETKMLNDALSLPTSPTAISCLRSVLVPIYFGNIAERLPLLWLSQVAPNINYNVTSRVTGHPA